MTDESEVKAPETEGVAQVAVAPAPEPDYMAQLAELQAKITSAEAERARLEQQVASYRGVAGQKLDYEAETRRLNRRLEGLSEDVKTLLDTASNGDEAVAQKVAALRQKRVQEEQQDALSQQMFEAWDTVVSDIEEVCDIDSSGQSQEERRNKAWELLGTDTRLKSYHQQAYTAGQRSDVAGMRQVSKALKKVWHDQVIEMNEKKIAEAKAAAKKEAEEAAQEKLRESGVLSMPAAKAAGGQGQKLVSHDEYIKMTPEQKKENYPAFMAWYKKQIGG